VPYSLPTQDKKLVQIIDAALVDSALRSGHWLVCKPGCTACCIGVFAIDQLDVSRLQDGLFRLDSTDPERSARVRQRARESWERIAAQFPGNAETGVLGDDDMAAAEFEEFADYEPCPALDPEHGTCDVYQWRPVTCRVFGPPLRSEGGLGVCELCYHGARPDEIAACELALDDVNQLQSKLVAEIEKSGRSGKTIVAFALSSQAVLGGRG
jgi:Fe-S-cluster containining protein